jgi:hypothetical protein
MIQLSANKSSSLVMLVLAGKESESTSVTDTETASSNTSSETCLSCPVETLDD